MVRKYFSRHGCCAKTNSVAIVTNELLFYSCFVDPRQPATQYDGAKGGRETRESETNKSKLVICRKENEHYKQIDRWGIG